MDFSIVSLEQCAEYVLFYNLLFKKIKNNILNKEVKFYHLILSFEVLKKLINQFETILIYLFLYCFITVFYIIIKNLLFIYKYSQRIQMYKQCQTYSWGTNMNVTKVMATQTRNNKYFTQKSFNKTDIRYSSQQL